MPKTFCLNQIKVDTERASLVVDGKEISVEPRAMDVLAYLATYPAQVISQETLFKELWPDTTFSPGSVQRCIAQIRKVLGDDAKNPTYIHTHPKRGYSLEVMPEFFVKKRNVTKIWGGAGLTLFFLIALMIEFLPEKNDWLSGQLHPVTSSASFDFNPVYSASGNSLAFIRQKSASNEIVVKDLVLGTEQIVLSGSANYQSLTWSYDNESFYFIVREEHTEWVGAISIEGGPVNRIFTITEPNRIWSIADDSNYLYYLMVDVPVNNSPSSRLIRRNKFTGAEDNLLKNDESFTPYRLAMSFDKGMVALAGETETDEIAIRLLSLKNNKLSEPIHKMSLGFAEISWHPNNESILVHHKNELFKIDLSGQKEVIPYFDYQRLFNPVFHPNGKKIAITHTNYDTDLIEVGDLPAKNTMLIDSLAQDYLARYSPSGNSIAFVSQRSGKSQIYLYQDGQQQVIADNFSNQTIYRAPVWSKNGEKIFFSLANTLYEYSVADKNSTAYNMPSNFLGILDTYDDEKNVLIASSQGQDVYFEKYDLFAKQSYQLAKSGTNFHGRLDNNNELVFIRDDHLVWGERAFDISAYHPTSSAAFPVNNKILFQSGREVVSFDGSNFEILELQLPDLAEGLIDVISNNKLMFTTEPKDFASIAEIR